MNQTFQLMAPRDRMILPWNGTLEETLFDGSAEQLVRLLIVPVRPRSRSFVSDTAPSIPAAQSPNDHCAANMTAGGSVREPPLGEASKRKADSGVLAWSPHQRKRAKPEGSGNRADAGQSVAFYDLPTEIHRLIYNHIEDIADIVCLGCTSRYFWSLARAHVHSYYESFLGQLANKNIVCVGEYAQPDDFPPGLFSDDELENLCLEFAEYPPFRCFSAFTPPFTLDSFGHEGVSCIVEDVYPADESRALIERLKLEGRDITKDPAYGWIHEDVRVSSEETYVPEEQPWILRNLTTKEFVRAEVIALKPEFIHGPHIDILGFGEVIISRVCWSALDCASTDEFTNMSRGVWAGHCFDITTLAKHRDETKGREWTDVSKEVASEIETIWESSYGLCWRESACNQWDEARSL